MSAETGVGPSIASGSQVCSGTWADLAAHAIKIATQIASSIPGDSCGTSANTAAYVTECNIANSMKIANIKPTSPTTLITNALRAAATAEGRSNQNPIRKYEAR